MKFFLIISIQFGFLNRFSFEREGNLSNLFQAIVGLLLNDGFILKSFKSIYCFFTICKVDILFCRCWNERARYESEELALNYLHSLLSLRS